MIKKSETENEYYKWIFLDGNEFGLTHALHDKKKDEWFLVHATMHRFPAKFENGIISGLVSFSV